MEKTQTTGQDDAFVVITGCSGGGKSTLLAELGRRGYQTVREPGRNIVKEQLAVSGDGLPWVNAALFAQLCIDRAIADFEAASGLTFFDRSLLDNISALSGLGEMNAGLEALLERYRYAAQVFFAPPWPEIFAGDAERRHTFEDAQAESEALGLFYPRHGYELIDLPKTSVAARAGFVLANLA